MLERARQARIGCECDEGLRTPLNCWSCTARCATCGGDRRIDLNANWHGPPGVERHHWIPCPDCAHVAETVPEPPRVVLDDALVGKLMEEGEIELAETAAKLLRRFR